MAMAISRLDVYLINLGPTLSSEIRKTRPCLVVSPDELNHDTRAVGALDGRAVLYVSEPPNVTSPKLI